MRSIVADCVGLFVWISEGNEILLGNLLERLRNGRFGDKQHEGACAVISRSFPCSVDTVARPVQR